MTFQEGDAVVVYGTSGYVSAIVKSPEMEHCGDCGCIGHLCKVSGGGTYFYAVEQIRKIN